MHTDWSSLSLLLIVMILGHIKQKPTKSQQIRRLHKKTFLVNCWPSGKYVHLLYMYSILGRGSFCFNYCLNSAWHGGDQFVALLRWFKTLGWRGGDKLFQKVIIYVFFVYKMYSRSFVKLQLNPWCQIDYFTDLLAMFLDIDRDNYIAVYGVSESSQNSLKIS